MDKYKSIIEKVKNDIRPDEKKIQKDVNDVINQINSEIKKCKIKAIAISGGSVAKKTFIKCDYDVDIFVKFNYSYINDDISVLLGKILEKFNAEKVHGSRDYFQIKNKIYFEIVPVLDIKNPKQAKNVTDMSPFHVEWVKNNVKKNPKLIEEIRVAKQFCKSANVYGAESYIGGFSGHVLDILVIYYDGFMGLLKAAVKWKNKEIVDFYNIHKGKALDKLNKSKLHSPLIIIDPILPERNAAAALNNEKFMNLKKTAKNFIDKPSLDFFVIKKIDVNDIKNKAKDNMALIIDVIPIAGKTDIVGGKLVKAYDFIFTQLKYYDFIIIDSGWYWKKEPHALFWFILPKEKLEKEKIMQGPPIKNKFHVENFMKKHKVTYQDQGKVYAKEKREFIDGYKCISTIIKEKYFCERINSSKMIL